MKKISGKQQSVLGLVALALSAASSAYAQVPPQAPAPQPPKEEITFLGRVFVPTDRNSDGRFAGEIRWIHEYPETPKLNQRLVALRKRCAGLQSNAVKVALSNPAVADFAKKQKIKMVNLDQVDNTSQVLQGDDVARHMTPRLTLRANQMQGQALHLVYNIDHTGRCSIVGEPEILAEFNKWIATVAVSDASKVNHPPGQQPGQPVPKKDTPAPVQQDLSLDALLKRMTEQRKVAGDPEPAPEQSKDAAPGATRAW